MSFFSGDTPFRFHIRPDPTLDAAIVVRFEVGEGMGLLGLRKVGREDPQPTMHYEEPEVEADYLRAGRFVHVVGSGQRQSYALSRISAEVIQRLPPDEWTELAPVTEYGFRYLVVPEEVLTRARPAAAVQVSAPAAQPAGRPQAVSRASSNEPPQASAGALPPRQVPMEPTLAELALDKLDRQEAVAFLRSEMAKVERLHQRVVELEQALEQSKGRERDLLDVLQKWQRL